MTETSLESACASRQAGVNALFLGAGLSLALCLGAISQAHAEENGIVPYLAGVEIGIPTGAAPPPGVYVADTMYLRPQTVYNGQGKAIPVKIGLYGNSLSAVWVPGVHLLGGDYLAFVKQPIDNNVVSAFGHHSSGFGIFNTIVSPVNISWMINYHLFAAAGMTFYLKDGTYSRNAAVEIGNNFYTFEPSASVSYFNHGLILNALALYDIDTANTDSPNAASGTYQSGNVLSVDLTATQAFGNWNAGLGGYAVQQTTDDTADGAVVPATPYQSRGDRIGQFALGPLLGYNLRGYSVTGYDTYDIRHVNTAGGNTVWLRLAARF